MPTLVRNYFLESSPSATLIMDSPQVLQKRSRQEVEKDSMAKKVAKLEQEKQQTETMAEEERMLNAKVKMQDEIIAEQKAKLQMQDKIIAKLISQMIDCKMAELQVQVVGGGNPDYELIQSIKSMMELTPDILRVSLEAQFSFRYKEMFDASQWANIEMELGITFTERTTHSNNIDVSHIPAAALPPAPLSSPSPSSSNMATSSSIGNMAAQPSQSFRF